MPTPIQRPVSKQGPPPSGGGLSGALFRRLLVLSLLPITLIAGGAYVQARTLLLDQATDQVQVLLQSDVAAAEQTAADLAAQIERFAAEPDFARLATLGLRADPTGTSFANTRTAILGTLEELNSAGGRPLFDEFLLLTRDGTVLISTIPELEDSTPGATPVIEAAASGRATTALFDEAWLRTDSIALLAAAGIGPDGGNRVGTLVGLTGPETLFAALRPAADLIPGATSFLISPSGEFISTETQAGERLEATESERSSAADTLASLADAPAAQSVILRTADAGGNRLQTHVAWVPALEAGIGIRFGVGAVYSRLNAAVRSMLIVVVAAFAVMALIAALVTRRGVLPLRKLAEQVHRFANGDMSSRYPGAKRRDEIGVLGSSFNQMADQLSQAQRAVERRRDERTEPLWPSAAPPPAVGTAAPGRELERLYTSAQDVAAATDETQLFERCGQALREAPYAAVLLRLSGPALEIVMLADHANVIGRTIEFPRYHAADLAGLERFLADGAVTVEVAGRLAPQPLQQIAEHLTLTVAAYLPIMAGERLAGVILLGTKDQPLPDAALAPYAGFARLASDLATKLRSTGEVAGRLTEAQALRSISQAVSSTSDLDAFFAVLHSHVRETIGDFDFLVALYDEEQKAISVPYSVEGGKPLRIDPFPLGEGLTSILIRTKQPLLLVEDTERKAAELGARVVGQPARSWMGAPMQIEDRVVGALMLQDAENDHAFTQENLHFLTALAAQVAGVIRTARLLDESRHRAVRLEAAAEIARDIGSALDLDDLLSKAVTLIRERFAFYHSAVFLVDPAGEFAVVREATGEAGAQMKRQGHRLAVGSRSIVGFVTGKGEQLVVNDTTADPIHLPNPLLPDTRSEAALPLRVGERILGALDVQSEHPQAFSEDNLRSLQILADQLAVAVVNTELFSETQQHLARQRLLHEVTMAAASGTTLEEILRGTVRRLREAMGGDRVAIFLADEARSHLRVHAADGYPDDLSEARIDFGSGIIGSAAMQQKPVRVDDVRQDPRYVEASPATRSELAVPLLYREDLLGVLNVESERLAAYDAADEETLGTLARSLAAIISNARLLEQIRQRADRERLLAGFSARIGAETRVDGVLQRTVRELASALGGSSVTFQLAGGESLPAPEDKTDGGGRSTRSAVTP